MTSTRKPPIDSAGVRAGSVHAWMAGQSRLDLLRFITCGSVDDGKSTLIGRLLWESRQVFDDQMEALMSDTRRYGTQGANPDLALLVDGLTAEREQGITIDVAYRFFSTSRRKFIVADTPGHEQYTRNMVTGASTADVAVLLVDAAKGVMTQTRRHAYLAHLMGIRHVVLAINKIDQIGFRQLPFDAIVSEFAAMSEKLAFDSVTPIPLSALTGDNVTARSSRTPWYDGPTLIGCLEELPLRRTDPAKAVFPIQWVNRPHSGFRGFCGTLTSGRLEVGALVRLTNSGQKAALARIVTADGDRLAAEAGDAVTLVLDREIDASRGEVIARADQPLEMTDQFEATLVWLHDEAGLTGRSYELKLANQWAAARITKLKYGVDIHTQAQVPCRQLALNDIAVVNLALSKPLVFEPYAVSATLGGFILVDKFTHATVAAGMVRHNLRRAQNVHRQALSISRQDRERLNGHPGKVIWFTGLSGSGKSTLANALEQALHAQGRHTFVLDGDNIRQGLNRDLGFTDADRVENIRRVAEVAKLMMEAGLIVMAAFISPFRAEREMARELVGPEHFIEVHVNTPLEVCEQRDVKGLYRQCREGKIPNLTGINSPYEAPTHPDYVANGDVTSLNLSVDALMKLLISGDVGCTA